MKKIISILLAGLFVSGFAGCGNSTLKQKKENKTEESVKKKSDSENNKKSEDNTKIDNETNIQVKKDIKKKTVVIDPGHGAGGNKEMEAISPDSNELKIKDPGGAQGVSTGIPEYEVNLKVAEKLKAKLEAKNINVVMTKTTHNENPGNIERAEIANRINADLEIRLHCDSSENSSAHGASMLVPGDTGYAESISSVSRSYGEIILTNLVNTAGMYNRGIDVRNDLTGFNWSKVPIVLAEMGFMSNYNEDELLNSDEYEEKLAQGLCDGIVECLSNEQDN